jgi:cytochrome c-type biogenesis protein CcmE
MTAKHIAPGTRIRLGGVVKPGSVVRGDNLKIRFDVTDGNREITVAYQGVLKSGHWKDDYGPRAAMPAAGGGK